MTDTELIQKAQEIACVHKASDSVRMGDVGCALISDKGNLYVGVSIDAAAGIGFCAEHSAVSAMVTQREYRVKKIVAVLPDGTILPPCGRCRELLFQVCEKNYDDTEIIVSKGKTAKLRDLLPDPWQKRIK